MSRSRWNLHRLLEAQLDAGIAGRVPCDATGESPAVTAAARDRLIELSVAAARPARGDRRPTVPTGTRTGGEQVP